MKLLSDLYKVTLKRGIRGKAKEGFVRPTIGENFMSHKDFIKVVSSKFMPETLGFLDVIEHPDWAGIWWKKVTTKESVNILTKGKWYLEQNILYIYHPTSARINILDADTDVMLASAAGYAKSLAGYLYIANAGDVMGLAVDVDSRKADVYENGNLKGTLTWDNNYPLKLVAALQNHGTKVGDYVDPGMGKIQINPGPDFSYPVPDGYEAFIDL